MKKWTAIFSVNGGEYSSTITFLAKEATLGKEREFLKMDIILIQNTLFILMEMKFVLMNL